MKVLYNNFKRRRFKDGKKNLICLIFSIKIAIFLIKFNNTVIDLSN